MTSVTRTAGQRQLVDDLEQLFDGELGAATPALGDNRAAASVGRQNNTIGEAVGLLSEPRRVAYRARANDHAGGAGGEPFGHSGPGPEPAAHLYRHPCGA